MDDCKIFFTGDHFTTSSQVKNTLEEVTLSLSKFTNQENLHECKHRGFTSRFKPLIRFKKTKPTLNFTTKLVQFWNKMLWTDETKINLYQDDGKRRV